MSVVGFDLGNESCVVAVARQRGIDVVLNDESKRETPAVVCFGDKQRFIGTAGAASSIMNPKNSISQIKRLLGRPFRDPDLQRDLCALPYTVSAGPDGLPLIHARYLGEDWTFTPTQVLAMLLGNLKAIASRNLNAAAVVDCCIGIPVYFTDSQRRAVLDAAAIAGLHPLRLIHETTATALAYGIYKTDLPDSEQINVVFVDVGHASMQVCVGGYKKGQLKVLAHAFDRNLGGRDFDEVLFQHFAKKFKEEYKIDVLGNARASLRLRTACEKLKKVLSANPEAPINIECLMDEKDVRGFIKREEFEEISRPILERVKGPLEKALRDAGIGLEGIHTVEVVGSGSRVPAVIKILTEFFGKEPRRTMNASECVARGCALQCAILSPTFKVREFQVQESFPFSISLAWKNVASESPEGAAETNHNKIIFPKGSTFPAMKSITFRKSSTFPVHFMYTDAVEVQNESRISKYMIGPFQSANGECATLKLRIQLNIHGVVTVDSATMMEDEVTEVLEPINKPVKEDTKMDTDETPNESILGGNDVNMSDAKATPEAPAKAVENGSVGAEEAQEGNSVPMDTDGKVLKKKVKKTKIPFSDEIFGAMSREDLQRAIEKEGEMDLHDRVMEDTKDRKNAVESYVYDMRNKLHDKYHAFVDDAEREKFSAKLSEVEGWLYDEGEDETRGVYVAKLEELKKQGDPIEERYKENLEREPAIEKLLQWIHSCREAALSKDPKFEHIDTEEKHKVIKECGEAENWLNQRRQHQYSLPKYATPVLTLADLKKKIDALDGVCRPILSKPKPVPAPKPQTETPPAAEPHAETREQHQTARVDNMEQAAAGGENSEPSASESMETDKSDTAPEPVA